MEPARVDPRRPHDKLPLALLPPQPRQLRAEVPQRRPGLPEDVVRPVQPRPPALPRPPAVAAAGAEARDGEGRRRRAGGGGGDGARGYEVARPGEAVQRRPARVRAGRAALAAALLVGLEGAGELLSQGPRYAGAPDAEAVGRVEEEGRGGRAWGRWYGGDGCYGRVENPERGRVLHGHFCQLVAPGLFLWSTLWGSIELCGRLCGGASE